MLELASQEAPAACPRAGRACASVSGATLDDPIEDAIRVPIDVSLAALMLRIQRRDEAGLSLLYRACGGKVFSAARRIVPQDQVASEVVSATFMQVWSNALLYEPARGSVLAWLMMLTRSRALDALRHLNVIRRFELPFDEDDEAPATMLRAVPACEPLVNSEDRCRRLNLQRAMLRLSAMQRQVVTLTTLGGLSHDEAACHLHLPLGTVKSHARRGLQALRRHCEALGVNSD